MTLFNKIAPLTLLAVGALLGSIATAAFVEDREKPLLYELRTYTTVEGRLPALHARFQNHTLKLFEKHGMKNVIYLTPADQPNTLIYLIAHKDKESRDASFEAFRADPDWIAARDASEKDGKIVEKVDSVFLQPTEYSPMK
jgi:hypothetical protein